MYVDQLVKAAICRAASQLIDISRLIIRARFYVQEGNIINGFEYYAHSVYVMTHCFSGKVVDKRNKEVFIVLSD